MDTKKIKYLEICEYFKNKIDNNEMKPGEKLPTEYDMVDMFSVSRHTVRQAILELEREKYIYREKGVGAFCADREKDIVKEQKMIMVITTYISDYIFPYIIRGIEEILSQKGYGVILFSTRNEKEKEAEQLKKLLNYNIVGAIIEPTTSAIENVNSEYYMELNKKKIPYIMINSFYEGLNKSYVDIDDEKGGYLACKHLLDLGHKKIAAVFKEDDSQGIKRKRGYIKALEEYNVNFDKTLVGSYKTFEEDFYPYAFVKNLLSKGQDRPTAVVAYNDKIAVQIISAARELGLKIPEDLSIVGYDNEQIIASIINGGLTTIDHPKEELGKLVATELLNIIEDEKESFSYTYEPKLIIKKSTKNL